MDTQRPMYQGDWACSSCGAKISELPFDPRDTSNILCRDCHRQQRGDRPGGPRGPRRDRPMHQGNWTCSECGNPITELPFEPRDTGNLKCKDCFRGR